jgi:hypothetical protein
MSDPQFLGHVLGYLKSVEATQPHRMEAAKMAEKRVAAQEKALAGSAPAPQPDAVSGAAPVAATGGELGRFLAVTQPPAQGTTPEEMAKWYAYHQTRVTPEDLARYGAMQRYAENRKDRQAAIDEGPHAMVSPGVGMSGHR